MKIKLLVTILLSVLTFGLIAQEDTDYRKYVDFSKEFESFLRNNQNKRHNYANAEIPIQLHISTKDKMPVADLSTIYSVFSQVNESFKATNMKFVFNNTVNYINDNTFTELDSQTESDNLTSQYRNPNAINIYYVKDINHINACGYASVGWSTNGYIVMNSICINSTTLVHELGHFFSLHHTHGGYFGQEYVNGSNCSTAGDGICDTPADPNLAGLVDYNCNYLGKHKDSNNDLFKPDPSLFMSYSLSNCRKRFTDQQLTRMRYYFDNTANSFFKISPYQDFATTIISPPNLKLEKTDTISAAVHYFGNQTKYSVQNITMYLQDKSGKKYYLWKQSISQNWSANTPFFVKIPLSLDKNFPTGNYTLIVENENNETEDKSNNIAFAEVIVYDTNIPLPDLKVVLKQNVVHMIGKEVLIDIDIKNEGDGAVPGTNMVGQYFYLSNDEFIDSSDMLIINNYWNPSSFPSNGGVNSNISVTLPNNEIYVPHYLICAIDLDSYIKEKNELNNIYALKINSLIPNDTIISRDLLWGQRNTGKEILSLTAGVNSFDSDHKINTPTPFDNTTYIKVGIYLSNDNVFDKNDRFIGISSNFLFKNNVSSGSWLRYKMPNDIKAGKYYIIYQLDPNNEYFETDETNNISVVEASIVNTKFSDIILDNFSTSDSIIVHGEKYTINTTSTNIGDTATGQYNLIVFLEATPFIYYHNSPIHGLNAWIYKQIPENMTIGKTHKNSYTQNVIINNDFPEGDYYMNVCTFDHSEGYVYKNNCAIINKPVKLRYKRDSQIPSDSSYFKVGVTLGVDEKTEKLRVEIYPNPTSNLLYFNTLNEIVDIEVYNVHGLKLENYSINLEKKTIDLSNFISNQYLVKVKTKKGVEAFHIIKE